MQFSAERLREMGDFELANEQEALRAKFERKHGEKDIPLTLRPTSSEKPRDLRLETYELLKSVREPSAEEKEALKSRLIFLPVRRLSYAQVVAEDEKYYLDGELNWANARPAMRDYALPVAVEMGFRLKEPALKGSFDKSQAYQLKMIEESSQTLQAEFPNARAIMLPVTGYAQADKALKANTGQVLIKDFFARGLDVLSEVRAAVAGRGGPGKRFRVDGWDARLGYPNVGALPAVVFVGNK